MKPVAPAASFMLLFVLFMILLLLPACNRTPKGTAADGVRWFKLHRCNGCHGEGGKGAMGPAIAATKLSYNSFLAKLRAPHSAVMPTFSAEDLPESDAADIYLWLQNQNKNT